MTLPTSGGLPQAGIVLSLSGLTPGFAHGIMCQRFQFIFACGLAGRFFGDFDLRSAETTFQFIDQELHQGATNGFKRRKRDQTSPAR